MSQTPSRIRDDIVAVPFQHNNPIAACISDRIVEQTSHAFIQTCSIAHVEPVENVSPSAPRQQCDPRNSLNREIDLDENYTENPFYHVVTSNLLSEPIVPEKNAMAILQDFNTQHLRIPTVCAEDRFSLDGITNNMINVYKMQRVKNTFLSDIKRLYVHNREILETAKICDFIENSRLYTLVYIDTKLVVYDNA